MWFRGSESTAEQERHGTLLLGRDGDICGSMEGVEGLSLVDGLCNRKEGLGVAGGKGKKLA